jgi:hypothetical protein
MESLRVLLSKTKYLIIMETFHKIVHKYRHGEPKYSFIHKYIKCSCIQLELQLAIAKSEWAKHKPCQI